MELSIIKMTKEIKELKVKSIDLSKYEKWNEDDVLLWMLSLENGRYKKYENALQKQLKAQRIKGSQLKQMNALVIQLLGITEEEDQKAMEIAIKKLVNKNKSNNNLNEGSIAPTAYIG